MTWRVCMVVSLWAVSFALASAIGAQAQQQEQEQSAAPAVATTDGEITRIDRDAAKLTLRHGPIRNLEMPAMTMVFAVKDPTVLGKLKVGDKIRFLADRVGGVLTVITIEPGQ